MLPKTMENMLTSPPSPRMSVAAKEDPTLTPASPINERQRPRFPANARPSRDGNTEARRSFAERLVAISLLGDAVVIVGCLLCAFWLRFQTSLAHFGVMPEPVYLADYAAYIAMAACSLLGIFAYFDVYSVRNLLRLRQVGIAVSRAIIVWAVVFLSFALAFKFQPPISRVYLVLSTGILFVGVIAWRFCFHCIVQNCSASANLRQRILFVGWNKDADRLAHSVMRGPHSSHAVVGYVRTNGAVNGSRGRAVLLGGLEDLPEVLHEHDIDVVILSSFDLTNPQIISLANLCEREMRQFKVIPSFFPILVSGLRLETISTVPVLGVSRLPLDYVYNRLLKRAVDIGGAVIGLLIFAPLILLFCGLVYRESPGPPIYWQWRSGRQGRRFKIFKIRSMRLHAERHSGPRWTANEDPRRLRIGRFIRKYNIDELPQLLNVLKGEMSLVGPRPERPELIESFKFDVPHYNARHNVKAGMTGWAQVKGLRGNTDLAERIRCDLFYLENWSLRLDLQILALTLFARTNAY
jgi:exopolysaccharide biosynthesis polyprenyl glycosylphosphotransferase